MSTDPTVAPKTDAERFDEDARNEAAYDQALKMAPTYFKMLGDMSLDMTGHSSDPFVAFKQWQEERSALAEIYDAAKKADDLIIKLATLWRELNSLLFGKKMRPAVLSVMRSESARNRLSELIAKFEKWDSDSTAASDGIATAVKDNTETLTHLKLM